MTSNSHKLGTCLYELCKSILLMKQSNEINKWIDYHIFLVYNASGTMSPICNQTNRVDFSYLLTLFSIEIRYQIYFFMRSEMRKIHRGICNFQNRENEIMDYEDATFMGIEL